MKGVFITFEGVEGCGKSTQIEMLRRYMEELGHDVVQTREPGGTPIAEAIRDLLLDPTNDGMGDSTELLLYEAARAQHVHSLIGPALEAGKVVLCDRFADSTTAYQGAGRGLSDEILGQLHRIATRDIWPDLTFIIDIPAKTGLERARKRGEADRIEQESLAFHERVRQRFAQLAKQAPERITIVDGHGTIHDVSLLIRARVDTFLKHYA
jgi:dTMP kinase